MRLLDRLLVLPQHLLPQRALSAAVKHLTRAEGALAPYAIRAFCAAYGVDLGEAREDLAAYRSFNQFFTRALRPDARPVASVPGIVASPADGAISQLGTLDHGRLLQAKGKDFPLSALLAGDETLDRQLEGGRFLIVYLSPRDYHRVHAPFDCTVHSVRYVPGRLFSVNDRTSQVIDGLYARNERLVLSCDSEWGPCAIVMVGAMLVSAMELRCCDVPALAARKGMTIQTLPAPERYARGEEIGRFNMGSTVILALPPSAPGWLPTLANGTPVRMGQALSRLAATAS
jgi:phosphatidylserine decarboxylase